MKRVILHSDINHCYAQIEEMKYPALREVPMAVGGDEELRHGIILAKNDLAKTYGIKTGESLREAYAKCQDLLILPPSYDDYLYYTELVKDIYREYSDHVESFGLDEAWMDISGSTRLFGNGYQIAKEIQQRVLKELGLTISIGISFNKIFAKLGSDQVKHLGLVEITKENYKETVWPLPVEELFYVGRATKHKLKGYQITTIGELAKLPVGWMRDHFGKIGEILWWFANGEDETQVALSTQQEDIKSIGNAITAPKDIVTFTDAKIVYYVLVDCVAARLRDAGLKGKVISISLRSMQLVAFTRQKKLSQATNLSEEIMPVVLQLLQQHYDFSIPLRTIGITMSGLEKEDGIQQLNLFVSEEARQQQQCLEETMDLIQEKYGYQKARRCSMLLDKKLTGFDPKRDHIIHPVSFF